MAAKLAEVERRLKVQSVLSGFSADASVSAVESDGEERGQGGEMQGMRL